MTEGNAPSTDIHAEADQFMLRVIHDLRGTLRPGFLRAQMLERCTAGTLTEESQGHLQSLLAGNGLTDLFLTRLAEYCQAGRNQDRLPPLSAMLLLRNAIRQTGEEAAAGIILLDSPAWLVPSPLQKVFFELLDNARKFRKGPISVTIRSERAGAECAFEIRDRGIGFDPRYTDTIWDPLERLHRVGEYPGFGFGLAISRRIIRALGGRIWASSQPGEGSMFSISVPIA
jgi:signal transduction histidine kinase